MPPLPTMAQTFRDSGYQAYAVGKLHVYPQRDRTGFDDVLLEEQGRHQMRDIPDGVADDYELFLADQGYAGLEYASGMCQNEYIARPWHLAEELHPVTWAARQMCRFIRRRDPRKPGFWYLSFSAPHPPMTPLEQYLDLYRDVGVDEPATGVWSADPEALPFHLRRLSNAGSLAMVRARRHEQELAWRSYYATVTHIDHQIRVVLGTLREAGLLDNTVIAFTSDHGHMLGDHGLWCMTPFYEMSAKIPLILVGPRGDGRVSAGARDDRMAEFADLMPTLVELAGLEVPASVDRLSLISDVRRQHLYGEHGEGEAAMRMVRHAEHKLVYYAAGNRMQLFDLSDDPRECVDRAADPAYAKAREKLTRLLVENLYGDDLGWLNDGTLVGLPERELTPEPERGLRGQRGIRTL